MPVGLAIAFAGAVGALARWGLGGLLQGVLGTAFPWGTLAVNLLGCFTIGAFMNAGASSHISPALKQAVVVGFLGAFTTFSAFGHETLELLGQGTWRLAMANVGLNLILGLLMVWAGSQSAKLLFGSS